MRQRFRVIEGGRSALPPAEAGLPESDTPPTRWRVDLLRAAAVDAEAVGAWRALITRIRARDPIHADPDYLLNAARHQSGGRDLMFALAWGAGEGPERLHGVVPLAMPHRLWGNGRVPLWHPPGVTLNPSIDPAVFGAVRDSFAACLRASRPTAVLDLAIAGSETARPAGIASRVRAIATSERRAAIPPRNLVGIRPGGHPQRVRNEVERITDPARIRDAVETFLSLDASGPHRAIVDDPADSAMVRVVTRLFAQRRQAAVEFTRHDGQVVAGKLRLGVGPDAVVWRQAEGRIGPAARIERPA